MAIFDLLTVVDAASAGAASQTSATQSGFAPSRALYLILDVTSLSGTSPTLQLVVELVDRKSGKFVEIGTFTAISVVGTTTYLIGLGVAAPADEVTAVRGFPVPEEWRARVAGGGTITDADYTLSAQLIPGS
jgi:hypothetical protein